MVKIASPEVIAALQNIADEANGKTSARSSDASEARHSTRRSGHGHSHSSERLPNLGVGAGGYEGSKTDIVRGYAETLGIKMGEKGTKLAQEEIDAIAAKLGTRAVKDNYVNSEYLRELAKEGRPVEVRRAEAVKTEKVGLIPQLFGKKGLPEGDYKDIVNIPEHLKDDVKVVLKSLDIQHGWFGSKKDKINSSELRQAPEQVQGFLANFGIVADDFSIYDINKLTAPKSIDKKVALADRDSGKQ